MGPRRLPPRHEITTALGIEAHPRSKRENSTAGRPPRSIDLIGRAASIPDTRDRDELPKSVFADRVVWDFESLGAGPPFEADRDMLMEGGRTAFAEWQATHHAITNHQIHVDGDVATLRAHIHAQHWLAPDVAAPQRNTMVGRRILRRRSRANAGWLAPAQGTPHTHVSGASRTAHRRRADRRILTLTPKRAPANGSCRRCDVTVHPALPEVEPCRAPAPKIYEGLRRQSRPECPSPGVPRRAAPF